MTAVETHVFVDIEPGGLLLDLQSGQLFRLNPSAAIVWRRHLLGDSAEEIARSLAARFEIAEARAWRDVQTALDVSTAAIPAPRISEFHYQRSSHGYVFSRRGQPLFSFDR